MPRIIPSLRSSIPSSSRCTLSFRLPRPIPTTSTSTLKPVQNWSSIRSLTTTSNLLSSFPSTSRSLLSTTSPILSSIPLLSTSLRPVTLTQIRFKAYGAEYQPSQRKRKRKHGYLVRQNKRGKNGLAILSRRRGKGRRFLSH